MKKYLLIAAAFMAVTANAQEVGQVVEDIATVGTAGTYVDKNGNEQATQIVPEGTVVAQSANVTMSIACPAAAGFKNVAVSADADSWDNAFAGTGDSRVYLTGKGITGSNDNPKDADGGAPTATLKAPATGACFNFKVNKDGYLYVYHKGTANKNYFVFEEGVAIGYIYSCYTNGNVYSYQLKGAIDNGSATGADAQNEVTEAILCPKDYIEGYATGNAPSIIEVPVFADCNYVIGAAGSKMSTSGFFFSETKVPVGLIGLSEAKQGFEVTLLNGGSTGINNAVAEKADANAPIYNLAGQRVNNNFKGIAIQNGKKFIK